MQKVQHDCVCGTSDTKLMEALISYHDSVVSNERKKKWYEKKE